MGKGLPCTIAATKTRPTHSRGTEIAMEAAMNVQQVQERSGSNASNQEIPKSITSDNDPYHNPKAGKTLEGKQGSETRHCTLEKPKASRIAERPMKVSVKRTQTAVVGAYITQWKDTAEGVDQPGWRMTTVARLATTTRMAAMAKRAATNTAKAINETRTDTEKVRSTRERIKAEDKALQTV